MTEVRIAQADWNRLVERVTEARDYSRSTAAQLATLAERHDRHEARIGSLERSRSWLHGGMALLTLALTSLAGWLGFTMKG